MSCVSVSVKSFLSLAKRVAVDFWFGISQISRSSPTNWGLSNRMARINAVNSQTVPRESGKASFLAWSPSPRLVRCLLWPPRGPGSTVVVASASDVDASWLGLVSSCGPRQGVGELRWSAASWCVVTSGDWTSYLLQAHLNLLRNLVQAGNRGGVRDLTLF